MGCGYELLTIFHYPLSWAIAECAKEKNGNFSHFNLKEKRILSESNWNEWITVLNILNKRHEKVLCMCISWWKILLKLLQWPCNERLKALRATSARKRNRLHRGTSFPPPPSERKLSVQKITRFGSDEGKIALHSLDRDLRLALRKLFYYTRN